MEEKIEVKNPWFLGVEDIFEKLHTSPLGLSEEESKKRLEHFGNNEIKKKKDLDLTKLAFKQLTSPLIFILVAAAIITSILREWTNTIVIMLAVLINAGLGFYREYQAENTLEKLVTYIKDRSRVLRNKNEEEVESTFLVPGDVIKLSYGSRVPADGRIISANNFKVDEAILTGESVPETKSPDPVSESALVADRRDMVYAGTLVVEGFATAVISSTGKNTEIGKIAEIVSKSDRALTPIQKGVKQLSWYIFAITIFIILGIFILGVFRGQDIWEMLVLSAAVAVGAVPESLPIVLTVILSVGSERIASKKGVVRKLAAAETLGSATLVMTDKTGTLTKAEMELIGVHTFEVLSKKEYSDSKIIRLGEEEKHILKLALSNVDVIVQNPEKPEKEWEFIGHPFEVNIAKAGALHGLPLQKDILEEKSLHLPFNSSNKFSISKKDGRYVVMGAPDILLERSDVDKDTYLKIFSWIQKASTDGKRLIAIGSFPAEKNKKVDADSVKNIKFEGILSFFDPIREEVPEAMKNIEAHGVRVVIMTGDLKGTAISVAKGLGWQVKDEEVLTGEDIHSMKDEELLEVIGGIKIFARVTPEDKLRIGGLYQKQGEIVAMTGDGVNDSPALKSMDIGISLGSGSDVAQSAADLVLLDDNFQTISMAIDEGRKILSNIRKAFVYIMSNALDVVFVIGGSLIFNLALPLTALQIIWVNLLTDSLPALAFAYDENLDKEIGGRKKFKKELLTSEVKILSLGLGTFTSAILFVLYYLLINYGVDIKEARSVFFVCFSVYILVVAFSFRSLHKPTYSYNPFTNKKLNLAILVSAVLFLATIFIPYMRELFGITLMPLHFLWLVIVWIILNLALIEIAKWIFRLRLNAKKN